MSETIERKSTRKYDDDQIAWMNELRRSGQTTKQIAEAFETRYGVPASRATLHVILEPAARSGAAAGRDVRVRMTDETRETLIETAERFGFYITDGNFAGQGSIAKLCAAIARGEFEIVPRST